MVQCAGECGEVEESGGVKRVGTEWNEGGSKGGVDGGELDDL